MAAVYGGRTGAQLTLMDALTAGYRFLLQPAFVVPILIIGLIVNLIVLQAIAPFLIAIAMKGALDSVESVALVGALVASFFTAIIASIVGGLLLNLYGQVWAVMASTGEPPTWAAALARVRERWMSILGAGLIVGAITLGALIVVSVVGALLGGIGAILIIAGFIAIAYVGIRLSMAGWIAAEGTGAMDSVRASWELTKRETLLILGWSIVIAIVVGVISAIVGIVLNLVPFVGDALTQTIGVAFGFGATVTLYRRVRGSAASAQAAPASSPTQA